MRSANLPISYANAFLKPVWAGGNVSLMDASVAALTEYMSRIEALYAIPGNRAWAGTGDDWKLPESSRLPSLDALISWLPIEGWGERMNTLFLRLDGPLQSWGTRSRWVDRDTALEPTKSGVVGLLACTLGWGRDRDDDIRDLSRSLQFGVRVDRPGRLVRDYQTVFGGAMSAEGKIKVNPSTKEPETVVSPRFYLADASFLAAVQGEAALIERLAAAVQEPVWPPFLGRKSCPLAAPLFAGSGDFASLKDALGHWPRSPGADGGQLRAAIEVPAGQGVRRHDQIDTLSLRTYLPRFSRDLLVDPPVSRLRGMVRCISHA